MLSDEQRAIRRTGIGSSEIATICGENPFRSAHEVYLDKRNLLEPEPDSIATELGHFLEPYLASLYDRDSGRVCRRHQMSVAMPNVPIARATIDYETDDGARIVECKTIGSRMRHHWQAEERGHPAYVEIQGQWQMGVLGRERCDVAALFLGYAEFRIYQLVFRPDMFASLLKIATDFWSRYVEAGEPPPPDETEACRRALLIRYDLRRTELAPAPAGFAEMAQRRMDLRVEQKEVERKLGTIENEIRKAIGHEAGFHDPTWGKVTHNEDKNGKRSLRFYPAKEKR